MYIFKKVFSQRTMSLALEQFGTLSLRDFILYSIIGVMIVILVVLVRKLFNKETELSDILTGIIMAVYVSIILQLTLVCRSDNSRIGIELDIFHGLVGPENDFHWLMIAYVVLNCMLFISFGFVLSLFSFLNERRYVIQVALVMLISLIVSLSIETTQLITGRGYYETQDMVSNALGGIIGWLVYVVLIHLIKVVSERIVDR